MAIENHPWVQHFIRLILLGLLLYISGTDSHGQVLKPFSQRIGTNGPSTKIFNINGDFTFLGNTNLSLKDYSLNLQNNRPMVYVDEDNDPGTFNSSMATLTFSSENGVDPDCGRVVFAGLYWTGRSADDINFEVNHDGRSQIYNKREVKIKPPGSSEYIKISAKMEDIWYPPSNAREEQHGMYVGYADVTSIVKAAGTGEYWLADLALLEGAGGALGYFGGWGLVVVYENDGMKPRDITVFDGYAFVTDDEAHLLNIDGFTATENGPVNVKLGIMSAEGDRGAFGDYLEIERGTNTNDFLRLKHDLNSLNNFFNASIFTEGNARQPELINNTGFDLSVFDLPNEDNNIIDNKQSSTRFKYGTDFDTFVIFNFTIAIDSRKTGIEAIHQLTSEAEKTEDIFLVPRETTLNFRLDIRNRLGEEVEDASVEIPIPAGLAFSDVQTVWLAENEVADAYFDPLAGSGGGTLVWEIGEIKVPESPDELLGYIEYTLITPENCDQLDGFICPDDFQISGELTGKNTTTAIPFSSPLVQPLSAEDACPTPDSSPIHLELLEDNNACNLSNELFLLNFCHLEEDNIPFNEVASNFPAGTKFYNLFPIAAATEVYTAENSFPKTPGLVEYVAVLENDANCYKPFGINYQSLSAEINIVSDFNGQAISCAGASDGILEVQITGGTPPYNYEWSDANKSGTPTLERLNDGTYSVTITDSLRCSVTTSITLMDPAPLNIILDTNASLLNPGCGSDGGIATFSAAGGSGLKTATLFLDSGNGAFEETASVNFQTSEQFSFDALSDGNYSVIVVDGNGCMAETDFTIENNADFSYSSEVVPVTSCSAPQSGSIAILPDDDTLQLNYLWSNGATTSKLENLGPGTYDVTITDPSGCVKEERFVLDEIVPIAFTINESSNVRCGEPGFNTTFELVFTGADNYTEINWSGGEVSNGGRTMRTAIPGPYRVTVTDENDCTVEQEVEVQPYDFPIDFEVRTIGGTNDFFPESTITFTPLVEGNVLGVLWDFGDGNSSTSTHPEHQYQRTGRYVVSLELVDENSCKHAISKEIVINSAEVRMPDAFTPDASNGTNTHYFPVFSSLAALEFWIFNKWGEMVYYTDDVAAVGWDGSIQGKPAPTGNYVYKLRYTATGESMISLSGSFLLIR
jgi:gliding motility-associated-like protein